MANRMFTLLMDWKQLQWPINSSQNEIASSYTTCQQEMYVVLINLKNSF